jgi:hypothetical protein
MASMRRVRKNFRKAVLRTISTGDGNIETLIEIAGKHFGHDVGYEVLIKSFLRNEVSNSLSCLRTEGLAETVGRKWKPADDLTMEESAIVSTRRWKRLRGELKAEVEFSHFHGLIDEATKASELLAMVGDYEKEPDVDAVDAAVG